MTDEQLQAICAAAEAIKHWSPSLTHAWLDTSEDDPAAVAGHIDEDGNTWPVVTVDCDQYSQGGDSLPLAKHIATANPATVLALCNEIRRLQKEVESEKELRQIGAQICQTEIKRLNGIIDELDGTESLK